MQTNNTTILAVLYRLKTCSVIFILLITTNCFMSLKPPPITFTQTQTAAEKQIVGEDKELESNGWLISSIQTSSSGSEEWERSSTYSSVDSEEEKKYILSLQEIAYYAPKVRRLKIRGIVAEGLNGKLVLVENKKGDKSKEKEQNKQLLDIVNAAREGVVTTKLEKEAKKKKLSDIEKAKLKQELTLSFYNQTLSGEFYEVKKGIFKKKE
ncbi:MAG: DUF1318 domain-containing protein [Leptospiraceae bacterium]|nr:DUF1318 domain-containing protein [Leptospiraceae bacterium]MCP5493682.1 DUF1318 domain-containing protein [Leptospiraceae bacterium]